MNKHIRGNKKISIIALHLGIGGVENSITSLANMLSEKYDVEIIATYKLLDKPAFELNKKIKITYLIEGLVPNKKELKNAVKNIKPCKVIKELLKSLKILFLKKFKLIHYIKSIDTDIIITTRYFHNKIIGKYANKNIIKIAQEHNHHNNNNKYIKKVIKSVKNYNFLMPVSQELTTFYSQKLTNKKVKVVYIPHALDYFPPKCSSLNNKNIVSVGRLEKEKGFLDLIDVFKKIHSIVPTAKLRIVGEGSQREVLALKIKENNLEEYVKLCGNKSKQELSKIFFDSSLYLMTSFTESFGLVLIEAESYGIPLVSFDSAQGAKEIIRNSENGFLIENRDKDGITEKACYLLNNRKESSILGQNGRGRSQKYTQENISKLWYNFIESL